MVGSEVPVKVHQICNVKTFSIGEKGDAIGKVDNFVVFIPGGEIDIEYTIRIRKVFPRFAVGEIING